jgi:serine/threonine protein phosphatase PrpC
MGKTMKTIALIGDSHAKVVFRYLEKILPSIGFKTVYKRAENGWSLKKHISKGTLSQLKSAKPQIILASLGGNNQDMKSASYQSTVDQLISVANSIGAQIVWVGPTTSNPSKAPNTEKRHKWTHNFLSSYLPSKSIFYIDNRGFTSSGWSKDGVHYNSSFYKKWAQRVAKYLPKIPSGKDSIKKIAIWSGIGVGALGILAVAAKIIFGGKKGSQANATKCLTSGAVYKTNIQPKKLSMQVNLPMELDIDEEEASILETIWHNATETVLRPYFYQNNSSIPQQTPILQQQTPISQQQIEIQLSEDSTGEESVFLIDKPHVKAEDAPPVVARYGNSVLIAVADGMGGAGPKKVEYKGDTRTMAWVASRKTLETIKHLFEQGDNGKQIAKYIEKGAFLKGLPKKKSMIKSKLHVDYPTTVAFAVITLEPSLLYRVDMFWAGDSRIYVMDKKPYSPSNDCRTTVTKDHSGGFDAPLNRKISVEPTTIQHQQVRIPQERLMGVVCVTDGLLKIIVDRSGKASNEQINKIIENADNPDQMINSFIQETGNHQSDDISLAVFRP